MMHLSNIGATWVPAREEKLVNEKKNCINNDQKLPQAGKINKFSDSGSSVDLKWKKKKK